MSKYMYVEIDTPVDRIIYQRDHANRATIPIRGRVWGDCDITSAHARLVPIHPTWGAPAKAVDLTVDNLAGRFTGEIEATGGWYRLEVNAFSRKEGEDLGTAGDTIDHVGVGEVFITFGHSCAQGGLPEDPGAEDDRVSTVNYRHSLCHECQFPFAFTHLSRGHRMGPWNASTHAWGLMADALVRELNVPVMMYGAAFGGTNIEMNYKVTQNIPYEHSFSKYHRGMPYRPLSAALRHYAVKTGIRAVLTQHGGNDVLCGPAEKFFHEFKTVIEHTRQAHGFPRLAFMLMKEGKFTGKWAGPGEEVINAGIAKLIETVPGVFRGPYYGDIPGEAPYKPDGVHLGPEGLSLYAKIWSDAILNSDFLKKSEPCRPLEV